MVLINLALNADINISIQVFNCIKQLKTAIIMKVVIPPKNLGPKAMPEIKGCTSFRKAETKSRREFMKIGALGMGGLSLPSLLQA